MAIGRLSPVRRETSATKTTRRERRCVFTLGVNWLRCEGRLWMYGHRRLPPSPRLSAAAHAAESSGAIRRPRLSLRPTKGSDGVLTTARACLRRPRPSSRVRMRMKKRIGKMQGLSLRRAWVLETCPSAGTRRPEASSGLAPTEVRRPAPWAFRLYTALLSHGLYDPLALGLRGD